MNTENILVELRKQKSHLSNQLGRVDKAILALTGLSGGLANSAPKKRHMSAAARRKIGAAQRARWAKQKAQAK
jgi:hypothetical protein